MLYDGTVNITEMVTNLNHTDMAVNTVKYYHLCDELFIRRYNILHLIFL